MTPPRVITLDQVLRRLTKSQADLFQASLNRIVECEHGIPRKLWCERCEGLYQSVVEHAVIFATRNAGGLDKI